MAMLNNQRVHFSGDLQNPPKKTDICQTLLHPDCGPFFALKNDEQNQLSTRFGGSLFAENPFWDVNEEETDTATKN